MKTNIQDEGVVDHAASTTGFMKAIRSESEVYVSYRAIYDSFKRVVRQIGIPSARIHDLRHTYAVNCIRAGDDIKTVQSNLGHATAAFTLDVYGHFTDDMRTASLQRMEGFIIKVFNL